MPNKSGITVAMNRNPMAAHDPSHSALVVHLLITADLIFYRKRRWATTGKGDVAELEEVFPKVVRMKTSEVAVDPGSFFGYYEAAAPIWLPTVPKVALGAGARAV